MCQIFSKGKTFSLFFVVLTPTHNNIEACYCGILRIASSIFGASVVVGVKNTQDKIPWSVVVGLFLSTISQLAHYTMHYIYYYTLSHLSFLSFFPVGCYLIFSRLAYKHIASSSRLIWFCYIGLTSINLDMCMYLSKVCTVLLQILFSKKKRAVETVQKKIFKQLDNTCLRPVRTIIMYKQHGLRLVVLCYVIECDTFKTRM